MNDAFTADSTPVEKARPRRVQFNEEVSVFCPSPDPAVVANLEPDDPSSASGTAIIYTERLNTTADDVAGGGAGMFVGKARGGGEDQVEEDMTKGRMGTESTDLVIRGKIIGL